MFKTVAVAAAAAVSIPAGAVIWKRRKLANGAARTSKALVNAAQARRPVDEDHGTGAPDASTEDHESAERGVTLTVDADADVDAVADGGTASTSVSTVRAVREPVRLADRHTVA